MALISNTHYNFDTKHQAFNYQHEAFMAIKDKLKDDLKAAMLEKDTVRKNVVQLIKAGVLQVEKDKKITLDDEGVLDVIAKQLKQRRDSLPDYEKSGRDDLIAQLKREMELLMEYLPQQLTHDELVEIVKDAIAQTGASEIKDMGKIMAAVMPKTKGRADGKEINAIARELLS